MDDFPSCDTCGHRSYVFVDIRVGDRWLPVSYCAHHATKYWERLRYIGIIREDRRDKVNA